jgi:hypothetical protein
MAEAAPAVDAGVGAAACAVHRDDPHTVRTVRRAQRETPEQARTWQRVLTHYRRRGLCHRCASQAAWGHQNGFATIHPPCEACASIVATFAVAGPAANPGWRRLGDGSHD